MKTNGDMLHGGRLEARVPRRLGPLLRALRPGVREGGRADLGAHGPERADGHADLGEPPLHGRGGARLRARPPRPRPREGRPLPRQAHDLGPQPRHHVPARQGRLRRPEGGALRLGHGVPLVRRRPLRERARRPRRLARQAAAVHRGDTRELRSGHGRRTGSGERPTAARSSTTSTTGRWAGPTGTCCSTSGAARTTSATSASRRCTATRAPARSPSRPPTSTSGTSRSS